MSAKQPTVMDILKLVDRSNCGECGVKSCMAFAAQVVSGQRPLNRCPKVSPEALERYGQDVSKPTVEVIDDERREYLQTLEAKMSELDLAEAARRTEGELDDEVLTVRCFERVFQLDRRGEMTSQCHVNFWVHLPLLEYVLEASGVVPTGDWVRFRELEGAMDWARFFEHRCERGFQELADAHEEIFLDLLETFAGRPPEGILARKAPEADWCLVVWPLPKVPMIFAYWRPEGDFESKLTLLLDRRSTENLSAGGIYTLAQGMWVMFRRIVLRHAHADR